MNNYRVFFKQGKNIVNFVIKSKETIEKVLKTLKDLKYLVVKIQQICEELKEILTKIGKITVLVCETVQNMVIPIITFFGSNEKRQMIKEHKREMKRLRVIRDMGCLSDEDREFYTRKICFHWNEIEYLKGKQSISYSH